MDDPRSAWSWDQLPTWLSPILIVLYILRNHIRAWYIQLFKVTDDTREHRQELDTVKLEASLQDQAAMRLRQIQIDNQALNILKETIDWSRVEFNDVEQQVRGIHMAIQRNNDLITLLNQHLVQVIQKQNRILDLIQGDLGKDRDGDID